MVEDILLNFENFINKESEVDIRGVRIDLNYKNYEKHLWEYEDFCKIVDLQNQTDLFKRFQKIDIVYILQ